MSRLVCAVNLHVVVAVVTVVVVGELKLFIKKIKKAVGLKLWSQIRAATDRSVACSVAAGI